jgi:hypothetical protein
MIFGLELSTMVHRAGDLGLSISANNTITNYQLPASTNLNKIGARRMYIFRTIQAKQLIVKLLVP